jgi:hypothetical protein
MTPTLALLAECDAQGIRLEPDGNGGLVIDSPPGALTPDRLERLRAHKAALLAMLQTSPVDRAGPSRDVDRSEKPAGRIGPPSRVLLVRDAGGRGCEYVSADAIPSWATEAQHIAGWHPIPEHWRPGADGGTPHERRDTP